MAPSTRPPEFVPPAPVAPVAVTDTPEFKAALEAALLASRAEMQKMVAETIAATVKTAAPAGDPMNVTEVINNLAMAIAQMNDMNAPSSAPIRIPPEIMHKREQAREEMVDLLAKLKAEKILPRYRAVSKLWLNERVVDPFVMDPGTKRPKPVEFGWDGEPSDAMRPADHYAEQVYSLFKETRAGGGKVLKGDKRYWMTKNGLVVEGDPPPSTRTVKAQYTAESGSFDVIEGSVNPDAEFINVLGTVAAPAMNHLARA